MLESENPNTEFVCLLQSGLKFTNHVMGVFRVGLECYMWGMFGVGCCW